MERKIINHKIKAGSIIAMYIFITLSMVAIHPVKADEYTGEDLARAILADQSTYISSSYFDRDISGNRQSTVLSSLGVMAPTQGSTFALFSTGYAGQTPVTTYGDNPGDERGSYFEGGKFSYPRDEVQLEMTLQVPPYMHYLYYDVQFFSTEYPEYVGTQYNDKLTITVDSPSMGSSQYIFDINSGYFVLESDSLSGTGFDVYAQSGYPDGVDWIDTTYRYHGADAGASDLIPIGGTTHPVSPNELITVTIDLRDDGDNQFDSAAFIDNLKFSGYAMTNIIARKTAQDINGGDVEKQDIIRYTVTISNIGSAVQHDNFGHEFVDIIPANASYVPGSATATSGSVVYESGLNRIAWDGSIPAESSVSIMFDVEILNTCGNGSLIRNQGNVYWDSNEDFVNDKVEVTDDPHIDDGIDIDGDGETDDDDPTDLRVVSFDAPAVVSEGFNDDSAGSAASESYMGRSWFNTSFEAGESNFAVVDGYYKDTPNAFKTKMRFEGTPQYWYFNIPNLESVLQSWQVSFKCGNATEASNMYLDFYNSGDELIARLKFEYVHEGMKAPVDWLAELYYWSPSTSSWIQFNTNAGGYLYNSWYTLNIGITGEYNLKYILMQKNVGIIDIKQDMSMDPLLTIYTPGSTESNLAYIKWSNTLNPVVCPMFFWDDLTLGLIND